MGRMAVAAIVATWVIPVSILVNQIVPEPYMDEIFHIPQAQQYCRGNFKTWDPMITTPPGLYFLSLAHVASLFPVMWFTKSASSLSELCSTGILRSANGAMIVICSVLLFDIIVHLRPNLGKSRATVYAAIMSLYPVHWFFAFLYYTDVASVTVVLAMYLASLKRLHWISAMLGAFAIFTRQTNVVWVLFVVSIAAIDYTDALFGEHEVLFSDRKISDAKVDVDNYKKNIPMALNLRRRKVGSSTDAPKSTISEISDSSSSDASDRHDLKNCTMSAPVSSQEGLLGEVQAIFPKIWYLKCRIVVTFAPFIIVLVAFMTFVIWNGSIVLGAKEAHVASPHFAQIMYFGLVSAAAIAPVHFSLSQVIYLYRSFWEKKLLSLFQWSMALIIGFITVHFFSIAHPYLLADNRHYTFYIWRKIIKAHWMMKYLLVPVYVYSWFSIFTFLGKAQKKIWMLLFFLACAAVLIPAPLIEFRYYTTPIFLLILHSRIDDNFSWMIMAILYVAIDIFTMAMFLFRPFSWAHEPGIQRFIW